MSCIKVKLITNYKQHFPSSRKRKQPKELSFSKTIKISKHWPYSVYLYICTWPLTINFADMPINILSLRV